MSKMVILTVCVHITLFLSYAAANDENKETFEARCSICHQLPQPGMLKLKQWKMVLNTMQKRMESKGIEPLSGEEMESILEYLEENSRK